MTDSKLDGATSPGLEGTIARDAGEFAARWNACTPKQREVWLSRLDADRKDAHRCFVEDHAGQVELLHLCWHEVMVRRSGDMARLRAAGLVDVSHYDLARFLGKPLLFPSSSVEEATAYYGSDLVRVWSVLVKGESDVPNG